MRQDQANARIEPGPTNVPDVALALERASKGARDLRETIGELRGRLQNVLVPQPPATSNEARVAPVSPPKAPLVESLELAVINVQDQALHDLRALLNELAI